MGVNHGLARPYATAAGMMTGVRLGHINIKTPLIEETIGFFELLGLRRGVAATLADQQRNAWLYDEEGRPIVHVNALADGETREPHHAARLDHVAFDCEEEAAFAARLAAAGVPYLRRETNVPGLVQFNLTDPNGIRIELTFGHEAVRDGHGS